MNRVKSHFPRITELREGTLLATLAHAIWVCANPALSFELSWDGPNYSRQDSSGTRGTITFLGEHVVGAFRDDNSPRTPWRSGHSYDLVSYLRRMPQDLVKIAEDQTLQYLIDEYRGTLGSIVTALFWSEGDHLTASEPWGDVLAHGAHLVRNELTPTEEAITLWQTEYELTDSQVKFLQSLFERKTRGCDVSIELSYEERKVLTTKGNLGLVESRRLFSKFGIVA